MKSKPSKPSKSSKPGKQSKSNKSSKQNQENEQNEQSAQIYTNDSSDEIRLLLCPRCLKGIPLVFIQFTKGLIELIIQCKCGEEPIKINLIDYIQQIKNSTIPKENCHNHPEIGRKYCMDCNLWLCSECLDNHSKKPNEAHTLLDCEVNLICDQHSQNYRYYCEKCKCNLCTGCHTAHQNHQLIQLRRAYLDEQYIDYYSNINVIDRIMSKSKDLTHKLLKKTKKKATSTVNKQDPTKLISSITQTNKQIGEALKSFGKLSANTLIRIQKWPCYQLNLLFWRIIEQEDKPNENEVNMDDETSLNNHLLTNYRFDYYLNNYVAVLGQHSSMVTCLVQLKSGHLASGSEDCKIRLWDTTTYTCDTTLTGHTKGVTSLCQLKNGYLASGSKDCTIKLWNTTTYACVTTISRDLYEYTCLCELKSGHFVSGSRDCTIRLWDATAYTSVTTFEGDPYVLTCLLELRNGHLASASLDCAISLWNTTTYACEKTLHGHSNAVRCLAELNDGNLASGSDDCTIRLWSLTSYTCIKTLEGNLKRVTCLVHLSNGYLASGFDDCTLKLWDLSKSDFVASIGEHSGPLKCLVQLSNGDFVSASDDSSIIVWDPSAIIAKIK